jgi:hypothetical protein
MLKASSGTDRTSASTRLDPQQSHTLPPPLLLLLALPLSLL